MRMTPIAASVALSMALTAPSFGHDVEEGKGRLGSVTFANSCDAKGQKELQRAMAMLHSFWFSAGEKTFRHVLDDDPACGIATFGIAALLMNNPLAGQGASPKAAETAAAALGFTHRKLRQMDKAFEHYRRALAIKPEHRGAHEYIGEAYLMVDDLAGAERQLSALRALCLVPCEELKDLEQAIAEYKAAKSPRRPGLATNDRCGRIV